MHGEEDVRLVRMWRRAGLVLLTFAAVAASIALALLVTPSQRVEAAGQTIEVGAASPDLSWSGPGELDLFGQQIPTAIDFAGPVRPRLRLTHITLDQQLSQFAGSPDAGAHLESALARGFEHYVLWQVVVAGAFAVVAFGAVAGWLRRGTGRSVGIIAVGLVLTEVVNLAAVMFTAYSAPGKLRGVDSLQALTGDSPPVAARRAPAAPGDVLHVVVIGDSTAAGLGNPLVADPSPQDESCKRSLDSFAAVLERTDGWQVDNLACSGATISSGLLGPQQVGSRTIPRQVTAPAVVRADVVIVSIGANDVHWSDILRVCAVSRSCDNNAERAYLQQQLAGLGADYLRLIDSLQLLPKRPRVLVNQYYDPFDGDVSCVADGRISDAKKSAMEASLDAMNRVLRSGAQAASFATVQPDFTGHGLCSATPYTQGLSDDAPFHPTAAGELAIALADQRALQRRAEPGASSTGGP